MPVSANNVLQACSARDPGPGEQIENDEQGQDILRLLTTLSPNQQEVVRLKFQAGLSYRQIAEVTGLTVTNVGYLLHAALANLRERIRIMGPTFDLPATPNLVQTASHVCV